MTYEKIVEKVSKAYAGADASKIAEHVAVQFNVTGEGEGAFHLEVAEGKVDVQPYEYYDRDVIVTTPADTVLDVAAGKLAIDEAYNTGKLFADGNIGKLMLLKEIAVKKARARKVKEEAADAVKTVEKKAEVKKTAAKKTVKEAAQKAEDTAKDVAEKVEAAAKKTTKKAAAKAEETAEKVETAAKKTTKKAATKADEAAKEVKKTTKKAAAKVEETAKKVAGEVKETKVKASKKTK